MILDIGRCGVGWVRGQGEKTCIELGGSVALEVPDRHGEAIVMGAWTCGWGRTTENAYLFTDRF
jgi:hypothetical protein